ncbi:hypothetical protein NDU88_001683 [Pleurodeles waltl]|uniref:Uncharacterized protein n=1 Tax=Pleurodeles waltl TaxID=8319 RepID=A0AAV7Q4R2_PLEWA|nr:hypothetical protein NDU88_001683 [Pleurodeles waltl]
MFRRAARVDVPRCEALAYALRCKVTACFDCEVEAHAECEALPPTLRWQALMFSGVKHRLMMRCEESLVVRYKAKDHADV